MRHVPSLDDVQRHALEPLRRVGGRQAAISGIAAGAALVALSAASAAVTAVRERVARS